MANVAYIRVSTVEQNEARQIEALQGYNIDKFFTEKISGKNANRPQLQAMLEYVREGDTVYISEFARLARSVKDLLNLIDIFNNQGVYLISLKENLNTATPTGRLMLTVIGAINEFERENILERQREGIAIAKREGKYKGRQAIKAAENFDELYEKYSRREIKSKSELAKQLHISRPTLERLIKERAL